MDGIKYARWALVPGALMFALRSLLSYAGKDPSAGALGPITGITGALSAVGMAALLYFAWRTAFAGQAILAFSMTGLGHYGIAPASQDAGAALVYLGLGLASPLGPLAGVVAASGALMRADHGWGHLLVAAGALAAAILLAWTPRQTSE